MAKRSSLRASDADRERVAERLRQAATEGRLLAHELEERMARALRASTYGDLDDVVCDLPGAPVGVVAQPRRSALRTAVEHPGVVGVVAIVTVLTVAVAIAAMVTVVASGLWILPLVFFFVVRNRHGHRHGRRGRRRDGLGLGGPDQTHVHVHRTYSGRY